MLAHLDIRNVVLIDHLTLDLAGGLSVLTGETGAGKSILLDALGLIRGDRSDAGLVRQGADQASVTAAFDVPNKHPVFAVLTEQGVVVDTSEPLVLRRMVGTDGKSRAYINDQMVSVGLLKTIGQMLIDLHGQFETGYLFDPAHHRRLVDRFGNLQMLVDETAARWRELSAARDDLASAQAGAERAKRDASYLRDAAEDLTKLSAQVGEEDQLLERKTFLAARAQIGEGLTQALSDLQGENGAEPALARVGRTLDRLRTKLPEKTESWLQAIDASLTHLREVSGAIDHLLFDSGEGLDNLEQIEDRLYELRAAARRHNCRPDELPVKAQEFQDQLALITHEADAFAKHAAIVQRAETSYLQAAGKLGTARVKAATKLDAGLMKELPPLKLEKAVFKTEITDLPPERYGVDGINAIRFTAAMNPGATPGAIDKVASGGELSRLMLALKVVLKNDDHLCLIFDEVDSGLGGAVADAMGERLARLAADTQVLVVTHAPQVAARADHHFVVSKQSKGGKTTTSVLTLDPGSERREEIARMLSGAKVTDEARAAAQKLLSARAA